jgi:hypothetical protein
MVYVLCNSNMMDLSRPKHHGHVIFQLLKKEQHIDSGKSTAFESFYALAA